MAFQNPAQPSQRNVFACRTAWCGKAFPRRDYRDRHEAIHLGEKPFSCPKCQRRYYRRDVLMRHQREAHETGTAFSLKRKHVSDAEDRILEHSPRSPSSSPIPHPLSSHPSEAVDPVSGSSMLDKEPGDDVNSLYMIVTPLPEEDGFYAKESNITIKPVRSAQPTVFQPDIITENFVQFMTTLVSNLQPADSALSFRSAEYLETCLELYYLKFHPTRPILHRPSLRRLKDQDEHWLLLAVVLVGSAYSSQKETYQFASNTLYPSARSEFNTILLKAVPDVPLRLLQAAVLLDYFGAFWAAKEEHYHALVNHAMCLEIFKLAGVWQSCLPSSTSLAWRDWLDYEERKRLASFALIIDSQMSVAFGEAIRAPFRQIRFCLPCKDDIWNARTEEEWIGSASTTIRETPSEAAYEHILSNDTMSPGATSVFYASILLAGAVASNVPTPLRLPPPGENPNFPSMELAGVVLWSWHHAFLSSFLPSTNDRGNCEIEYHLSLVHNPNINVEVLRMASGEDRVGSIVVKPWQKEHALKVLAELSPSPAGTFALWHAVQIYTLVLQSSTEEHSHDPFTGWALYLATLAIWHIGTITLGKPSYGPLDRLCVSMTGPGPAEVVIEPRLARRSALEYLAQYEPHQKTPGHYPTGDIQNNIIGLLAYAVHFLKSLPWPILEQPVEILLGLLASCDR